MSVSANLSGKHLIQALIDPEIYPHPVRAVELVETHISWVLLAGDHAYKIKKPVNPGFLDFTTLEQRKHYCEEELRINQRLAPELYLDVIAIGEKHGRPVLGVRDEAIEYAVRMRRFDQCDQLDRQLEAGRLTPADMDELADYSAAFHSSTTIAARDTPWGSPDIIRETAMANFEHLNADSLETANVQTADSLRGWSENRFSELADAFAKRKFDGFVRECHGDLHLRNIARVAGRIVAFDAIEFSPALRWIDVLSDMAFLLMDLESRGRQDLGWRFLNSWLSATGDYSGLNLLDWYLIYRHLVRAKVDAIRIAQPDVDVPERDRLTGRLTRHLKLAAELTKGRNTGVVLVSGFSGSGKSWLSARLATCLPGIWIRSDIERKRIFGLTEQKSASGLVGEGIYTPDANRQTYDKLLELTRNVTAAKYNALVDASFLDPVHRDEFKQLAQEEGLAFHILRCEAAESTLRKRVTKRSEEGADPSDAG
ncbi:MAG: AAA family ATPase, partial [Gammaproteobacteria bacterium]